MNTDCTQTVFQTQNIYITLKKIWGRHFLKTTKFEDGAIYFVCFLLGFHKILTWDMLCTIHMAHRNFLSWFLSWSSMSWSSCFASEMQTQKKDPTVLDIIECYVHNELWHRPVSFFFFSPPCTSCGILVSWPGIEPGPRQWKCWYLTSALPGNSFFPPTFFTSVLSFHIPHLWTVQTDKKHLLSNWQSEGILHSYLLRLHSWSFPASHLCRVSSVRNPVKPTHPGWSLQPHPQRPMSPKAPKICNSKMHETALDTHTPFTGGWCTILLFIKSYSMTWSWKTYSPHFLNNLTGSWRNETIYTSFLWS